MRSWAPALVLAVLAVAAAPASAQVVYDLVTTGTISSSSAYACPSGSCAPCIETSPTYGPIISFGQTGFNGQSAWGTVAGTFHARATLDGVSVPSDLLPAGSFFRSGVALRHSYCMGFSGNDNCPGYVCGMSYQIGGSSGSFGRTTTTFFVDVPAVEAAGSTFRFDFCNFHITWGTGCNVAGSIDLRWKLHAPAPVRAVALAAGDAAPHSFPGTGLVLDKLAGPSGVVTTTRLTGPVLLPDPPGFSASQDWVPDYPGYWAVHSDMPQGGFDTTVGITYDPMLIRAGVTELNLRMWHVDPITGVCTLLNTTIDTATHTATATGVNRFGWFTLNHDPAPTGTRQSSWSQVKALYR